LSSPDRQNAAGSRPSAEFDELALTIPKPAAPKLLSPGSVVRGQDCVFEPFGLNVQQLYDAINVRFVDAAQHIIQNDNRLFGCQPGRERKKDA
jgi:hypothetical protein